MRTYALILVALAMGGCNPAHFVAQSQSANGAFVGAPGVVVLCAPDGTKVEASTLRIEEGPPMSSPHIKPPTPTRGREAILVDARQRIIAPIDLPPGQQIRVVGRFPIYMVYDSAGSRLTTEDGKNVGGALKVTRAPRAVQRDD